MFNKLLFSTEPLPDQELELKEIPQTLKQLRRALRIYDAILLRLHFV